MGARDWESFAEDLERAAGMTGEARDRFLDAACAVDPRRRARLERLLAADALAGDFLKAPELNPAAGAASWAQSSGPFSAPAHGDVLARYTILRCVGRGGIGTVYEASQENPRRKVALKLLDPGFAVGTGLQRFRFEALVLGQLQHPGIATVHEAGEDEHGRAFLAMEFVSDASFVTDYVVREKLSTRQRLSLFIDVCAAVAYAHGRGVIHRDLKPSNVLVDAAGAVKVIDFGIARALDSQAEALTREGEVVGTLAYMSPEQLRGRPGEVDVRSDVYALGVLLYEMLSETRLRDFSGIALPEVLRRIREDAPVPLTAVRSDLPQELGWITAKALESDPARRYGSVEEFTEDIARFWEHLPLRAGPPTAVYRMATFARRHRIGVALAAGLVLVLLGSSVAVVVAERRATDLANRRIEAEALARERVDAFQHELAANAEILALQTGWLSTHLLDRTGSGVRVVDVLDAAARDLEERCFTSFLIEAEARHALALALASSGLWKGAGQQIDELRRMIARGVELAPEKVERIDQISCRVLAASGRFEEAIAQARAALESRVAELGPTSPAVVAWTSVVDALLAERGATR